MGQYALDRGPANMHDWLAQNQASRMLLDPTVDWEAFDAESKSEGPDLESMTTPRSSTIEHLDSFGDHRWRELMSFPATREPQDTMFTMPDQGYSRTAVDEDDSYIARGGMEGGLLMLELMGDILDDGDPHWALMRRSIIQEVCNVSLPQGSIRP